MASLAEYQVEEDKEEEGGERGTAGGGRARGGWWGGMEKRGRRPRKSRKRQGEGGRGVEIISTQKSVEILVTPFCIFSSSPIFLFLLSLFQHQCEAASERSSFNTRLLTKRRRRASLPIKNTAF